MEATLRALALEELALHPFPGISFERLCAVLQQENDWALDPFSRAMLWRSLYRCPDVYFTATSSCSHQKHHHPLAAAPANTDAATTPTKRSKIQSLSWRDPLVPSDLLMAPSTRSFTLGAAAGDAKRAGPPPSISEAAAIDAWKAQQRQWLLATSPGLPLLLLTGVDAAADKTDLDRRAAEVPFQILRNIASHKENGQWQYCLAQELQLDPKSVFHHLKPLYRDELICHMQLAIPPTHKLGRGEGHSPTKGGPPDQQGREASSLENIGGHEGPTGAPPPRGTVRTNLTVSALLWSSAFFSPLRLPAHLRGLVALHHLLPLQQQALRLLHNSPNNILLEEEVRQFCISKLLTSEEAPYLRFSDKQLRRLFYRLRESLERSGQVQRVRAFCRQTARFEPCLILSAGAAQQHSAAAAPQHSGQGQTGGGSLIAQVKVEEGTVETAARAADLRRDASAHGATAADEGEAEESPSVLVDLEGTSLASLASLLLIAAGSDGLTTVGLSRLLGLDIKRSGKALAEFSRRNLVSRVAERRGKCFLYRYISKGLPCLQALLAEAPSEDFSGSTAETEGPAAHAGPSAAAVVVHMRGEAAARTAKAFDPSSGPQAASGAAPETEAQLEAPAGGASASPEKTPQKGTEGLLYESSGRQQRGRLQRTARSAFARVGKVDSEAQTPLKRPHSAQGTPAGASKKRATCRRGKTAREDAEKEVLVAQETDAAAGAAATVAAPPPVATPSAAAANGAVAAAAAAAAAGAPAASTASPAVSLGPDGASTTEAEAAELAVAVSAPAALPGAIRRCLFDGGTGSGSQAVVSGAVDGLLKEMTRRAARAKLPPRAQRLLETPQFVARLTLFQRAVESAGCCTIPSISKAIADAEQTPNGPDRKTVHRMAEVAMQLEPRIRRGRVTTSKNAQERLEGPAGTSPAPADITFFYWAESLDEETAEQRVAALITQRRAHGCREAIRRNQLLLEGKLKEAGEDLRLASSSLGSLGALQPPHTLAESRRNSISPQAPAVSGDVPQVVHSSVLPDDTPMQSLVGKQLKGLEREISRLSQLESRTACSRVTQPGPPATAASLLMVDKTLPRSTFQDKFVFSQKHLAFYGFIFPVMIRAKCFHQFLLVLSRQLMGHPESSLSSVAEAPLLTVSTMVRRMPLETFLRLIGCGYALPLLDEHLAKEAASRHPMQMLPGPLFRLLVFSSRQLQAYRQLHPKAQLPLLGLGKKNAGTAVRKLLSLLGRMGIICQVQAVPSPPSEGSTPKGPLVAHAWRLNEIIRLPAFSRTVSKEGEVQTPLPAREFDGLSHEGVEAYWQQLQLQVSQWVQEERQMTWAMGSDPQPSHFFSPHSEDSDGAQQSEREGSAGPRNPEEAGASSRWRVPLPEAFAVREAFNSKNWKGQVAFTAAARAALDAFAAETLEKLRDAGGAELEALVLNASSPQIVELSARIGYPADAVLRYLIRVFEIKGGSRSNQALFIGGSIWDSEERQQAEDGDTPLTPVPVPNQLPTDADAVTSSSVPGQSRSNSPRPHWLAGTPTKADTVERDRGPGLLVHRTRDVRFQCHRCGHFYSWEKSLRLHYERAHREPLPDNELLYILPWERKRRLEDQQQRAELSKFRRRRRAMAVPAVRGSPTQSQQQVILSSPTDEALKARESFAGRLLVRGAVRAVDIPASSFLMRATGDEQAVLSSMGREDEIGLIGAAVVAERLWMAAYSPQQGSAGPGSLFERAVNRVGGPLAEAWLFPASSQSLPPEEHLIWHILGCLCMPPLASSSARLFLGFVLSRRSLNSRIFSSFRRLDPAALRHFVLEGRIPSALELRLHSVYRGEALGAPRKSLVSRPLSCPRILMARNMLKAVLLTPLPFYRPAVQLAALRELRPLELTGLWRAWQRKGWVTVFKPPAAAAAAAAATVGSIAPPSKDKKALGATEPAGRQQHLYKRPEIATALEAKCRRPFVLSSSARLSLFGRLWDYRTLSALLYSANQLTERNVGGLPEGLTDAAAPAEEFAGDEEPSSPANSSAAPAAPQTWKDSEGNDSPHELLLAQLAAEEAQPSEEAGAVDATTVTNDGDLQLLQLLENSRLQPAASGCLSTSEPPKMVADSCLFLPEEASVRKGNSAPAAPELCQQREEEPAVAVVRRETLSLTSEVVGSEALAALEGLARGRLWLSPFWGREGRLPDSTEAAADAELLKLLEDEDALDGGDGGEGLWNNVPEWLSALSLGRAEEGGDLLGDTRPLRRPTEGGVETHITAHAAGVPEITAITCSVLGSCLPLIRRRTNVLEVERSLPHNTDLEGAPFNRPAHAVGSAPEIGSLCRELRWAFERSCAKPAVGGVRWHTAAASMMHATSGDADAGCNNSATLGKTMEVEVPPASHLPDGLFGAAGELDAFDPSLLPPVLNDRTSSAATSFTLAEEAQRQREVATEIGTEGEVHAALKPSAARPWRFKPGLPSGFPVSLPTYADDHRQNWRFAARAVEAFAPPGCLCNTTCGCLHESQAAVGSRCYTPAILQAPGATTLCSVVPPMLGFTDRPLVEDQKGTTGEANPGEGPLRILRQYLEGPAEAFLESPPAKLCNTGTWKSSGNPCSGHLPLPLLQALHETVLVALSVQHDAVLPLLPTPPLPVAAERLGEVAQEELAAILPAFSPAASAGAAEGSAPPAVVQAGQEARADAVVCVALALCPAWLLGCVLKAKAEGVAVPALLLELAGEEETAAEAAAASPVEGHSTQTGPAPVRLADSVRGDNSADSLRAAARLAFRRAVSKLSLRSSSGEALLPLRRKAELAGANVGMVMTTEGDLGCCCDNCWVAACGSQLFLVCVAILCSLRLVVPVPAGESWRLVGAAEAAPRFCLKEQLVVRDPLAARWAFHRGTLPVCLIEQSASRSHLAAADATGEKLNGEGDPSREGLMHQSDLRPAMVPRAIWAAWGPSGVRSQQDPQQQKQHPLAREGQQASLGTTAPVSGAACVSGPLTGVSPAEVSEEEGTTAYQAQAEVVSSLFCSLLDCTASSLGPQGAEGDPLPRAAAAPRPVRLASGWLPACAWMRLDGRLHASLVQLLCLRLWMLLTQRPGSTAQQLQGMLCLLDDCEVQFLLHALVEEGVVTASVLWGHSAAAFSTSCGNPSEGSERSPRAYHGTCFADSSDRSLPTQEARHIGGLTGSAGFNGRPGGLSMAKHILDVQAIYLPNAAADVLPKFQPLLLPKLARCSCGCSVLL